MPVSASDASAVRVTLPRTVLPGPARLTDGGVQSAAVPHLLAALAVVAVNAADENAVEVVRISTARPATIPTAAPAFRRRARPGGDGGAGGGVPPSSSSLLSSGSSGSSAVRLPKTAATMASSVSTLHHASAGRLPPASQRPGSPTAGTRSLAWPVICPRSRGTLSTSALASPAVTNVPSGFSATIRCSRVFSTPPGSASAGLVNSTTPPTGTFCWRPKGAASTTSPALMCGSMDPLCTTVPCQPRAAGSTANRARLSSTPRYSRDATDATNSAQPSAENSGPHQEDTRADPGSSRFTGLLRLRGYGVGESSDWSSQTRSMPTRAPCRALTSSWLIPVVSKRQVPR